MPDIRLVLFTLVSFGFVSLPIFSSASVANTGYYRAPDLHDNQLVFTAEGDIWLTDINTLKASRLTSSVEQENDGHISTDGKKLAFVANYEGGQEVYLMPMSGGVAKRVTFENATIRLQGWTQKGDIIYAVNNRVGPTGNWTLRQLNPETLTVKDFEVADAVNGDFDGKRLVFSQFGLQTSSDNSKVYRGGAMGQIWRYEPASRKSASSKEAVLLTAKHQASTSHPKIYNRKIYFVSDFSGNGNIWSMEFDGKNKQQLTHFKDFSIRDFNIDNNRLVFQLGADIHLFDLATQQDKVLPIQLLSDRLQLRERWDLQPMKKLTAAALVGSKKKVVVTARGRVAIANTEGSRLVEVNTPKDSRTRAAIVDSKGKYVYAINDASGELEIWRYPADGSKGGKQLTKDGHTFRWQLVLSPNDRFIAHDDQDGILWLLDLKTGKNKKLLSGNAGLDPYADIQWSDDSSLLAITTMREGYERPRVMLYEVASGRKQYLTSEKYESFSPTFSADGQWLYFLSNRNFIATPGSPWGDRNLGPKFDRRTGIYAIALNKKAKFPFQKPNELVKPKSEDKKDRKEKDDEKKDKATKKLVVDWQGIAGRLWKVPVAAGNFRNLRAGKKYLYVMDAYDEPKEKPFLNSIALEVDGKIKKFTDKVDFYQLSADRKKILLAKNSANKDLMYIVPAGETLPKKLDKAKVNFKDWQLLINPREDWRQLFFDAWIMHRDSLFDPKMRGVNWNNSRKKYQSLLNRVGDRTDLNDIFQQMMGELNALHSQVRGGDVRYDKAKSKLAVLGAKLEQTKNGVKIAHIYRNDDELPDRASPLAKPGVDAKNGDRILKVNFQSVNSIAEITRLLRNQAGKQVVLTLQRKGKSFPVVVNPIGWYQDFKLRYFDWVENNRQKVEQKDKDIGYLHIYAMGSGDIADFAREFYANIDKPGLIIDVRRNRGGNVDSWIIEKLLRKAWMFWQARIGKANTNMQQAYRGHLVVLADQMTYSDGETFTAGIKALNIAPVIGKRTAGAGVWLRGQNRLTDGGMARVAEFPQHAMDGRWIVEGHGIEPTIEVDNLPHSTYLGKDAQLAAAINYLQTKIKKEPIPQLKAESLPRQATPADDVLAHP